MAIEHAVQDEWGESHDGAYSRISMVHLDREGANAAVTVTTFRNAAEAARDRAPRGRPVLIRTLSFNPLPISALVEREGEGEAAVEKTVRERVPAYAELFEGEDARPELERLYDYVLTLDPYKGGMKV